KDGFEKVGFEINFIDQRYIAYGEGYVFVHNPFLGNATFFTLFWRSQDLKEKNAREPVPIPVRGSGCIMVPVIMPGT
ncbi:MAG: hypothetical protein Q7T80_02650, partial [Methanoregula sp.]|nr:hypothetical protein [Methanoregula sp.]